VGGREGGWKGGKRIAKDTRRPSHHFDAHVKNGPSKTHGVTGGEWLLWGGEREDIRGGSEGQRKKTGRGPGIAEEISEGLQKKPLNGRVVVSAKQKEKLTIKKKKGKKSWGKTHGLCTEGGGGALRRS